MSKYDELVKALREYSGCRKGEIARITSDAAAAIEALEAEVKRLKDSNEELREKQTYIDHYGDKWMTSAKDVPTSAYEHGYADGRDEALSKVEPKRGEWIEADKIKTYCSNCNWASYSMLVQKDAFLLRNNKTKFCPNCGAKMEVQE